MKKTALPRLKCTLLALSLFCTIAATAQTTKPGAGVDNLQVEYTDKPMGIDVSVPRFSWQMKAPAGAKGYVQLSATKLMLKTAMAKRYGTA
jgi:alpha-L-rhamnosidase